MSKSPIVPLFEQFAPELPSEWVHINLTWKFKVEVEFWNANFLMDPLYLKSLIKDNYISSRLFLCIKLNHYETIPSNDYRKILQITMKRFTSLNLVACAKVPTQITINLSLESIHPLFYHLPSLPFAFAISSDCH